MTRIHPTAIVDPSAQLGDGVEIGPYCVIGAGAHLSAGVQLHSHVVVDGRVLIGEGVIIHAFAVLGGPAQISPYARADTRLEIGAGCIIREYVTMNRGSAQGAGITQVGRDCLFMAQAHVAHDCQVGDGVTMAQGATLGGHAVIGAGAVLGGLCAIHQRGRVGRLAMIGGLAGVVGDVIPFGMAAGSRARLAGLNRVGLRRSGASAALIQTIARAYRILFHGDGLFAERLQALEQLYGDVSEVMEIVHFAKMPQARSLCMARQKWPTGLGSE